LLTTNHFRCQQLFLISDFMFKYKQHWWCSEIVKFYITTRPKKILGAPTLWTLKKTGHALYIKLSEKLNNHRVQTQN